MSKKLLGIIRVDFSVKLLIINSAFFKYLREKNRKRAGQYLSCSWTSRKPMISQ
jgi:hypothetical protein